MCQRSRMSGLDRLALVSKILLDSRFLELKRENERLKLSLFWVDHSVNTLKKMMCKANKHPAGPRCRCVSCMGILDAYDDGITDETCKFKPWFEQVLQEHGMSFGEGFASHDSVHFHVRAYDVGWYGWVYGAKLWNARSTTDAELSKLRTLFATFRDLYQPQHALF